MSTTTSRHRHNAGLPALTRMLWPSDAPVLLRHGAAAESAPAGQRFVPLPPHSPRVLVPLEGRAAASGSLVANLKLRHRWERAPRRAVSALLATGLLQRALRPSWQGFELVGAPATESSLLETLRRDWRPDVAAVSFTVREVTPNYKPTFIALDRQGCALGFGKITIDDGTVTRLRREITALLALEAEPIVGLRTPRLIAEASWGHRIVAVVEPLPEQCRRFPRDGRVPMMMLREALARGRSRSFASVGADLLLQVESAGDAELSEAAALHLDRLLRRHDGVELTASRVHGDWVPWNVAVEGTHVWAFDWEHSRDDAPTAMDVATWHQMTSLFRERQPYARAVTVARARLVDDLRRVVLRPGESEAVSDLATLHLVSRLAELFAHSGKWRDGTREGLIQVLL